MLQKRCGKMMDIIGISKEKKKKRGDAAVA